MIIPYKFDTLRNFQNNNLFRIVSDLPLRKNLRHTSFSMTEINGKSRSHLEILMLTERTMNTLHDDWVHSMKNDEVTSRFENLKSFVYITKVKTKCIETTCVLKFLIRFVWNLRNKAKMCACVKQMQLRKRDSGKFEDSFLQNHFDHISNRREWNIRSLNVYFCFQNRKELLRRQPLNLRESSWRKFGKNIQMIPKFSKLSLFWVSKCNLKSTLIEISIANHDDIIPLFPF